MKLPSFIQKCQFCSRLINFNTCITMNARLYNGFRQYLYCNQKCMNASLEKLNKMPDDMDRIKLVSKIQVSDRVWNVEFASVMEIKIFPS